MSTESKYTKGEWITYELPDKSIAIKQKSLADRGFSDRIAELHEYDYQTKRANANLISAAPNMYEALNEVLKYMTVDTPQSVEAQKKVIAAIRKAEGLD
jgi:hypothetical protein